VTAAPSAVDEDRSVDAFLGGRVTLVQPRKGHRAGLDAALLQALVPSDATGFAIDLGAGVGTVAFCLAARAEKLSVIGVERDADLVACGLEAMAREENASFADRVRLIEGDMAEPRALRERAGFGAAEADFVLMNPPFDPEGRVSGSPDERRRAAHVAAEGLIQSWSTSAAAWLKPNGILGLIHRADAVRDVLEALSRHFGGIKILPVHPAESAAAIRILVTAKRGSRAPAAILPGLVLHQAEGAWTPRADAILRGQGELAS
jgi:tRNA1(Val) A37 N6-methylase TrmN6